MILVLAVVIALEMLYAYIERRNDDKKEAAKRIQEYVDGSIGTGHDRTGRRSRTDKAAVQEDGTVCQCCRGFDDAKDPEDEIHGRIDDGTDRQQDIYG